MTLDRIAWFIGETARPVAIILTAIGTNAAVILLARKLDDPMQIVAFAGVIYAAGLAPLFLGKAAEVFGVNRNAAQAEIAKSKEPS